MNKYLSLLIITLSEATIGIFVKLTDNVIPIYTLTFYRALFAFLFLLATVPFFDKDLFKTTSKEDLKPIGIIGLMIAVQMALYNLSFTMIPVANAVVYWSTNPFFVFLISWFFLNEKPKLKHFFIFLLAFMGLVIANPLAEGSMTGNLIALSTAVTYAIIVSYMRFEGRTESSGAVLWYMLIASILTLPALFIFGPGEVLSPAKFEVPAIVWAIGLGAISTGLAYLFIGYILKKLNANIYALFDVIISPLAAALMAFFILREIPSTRLMIGGTIMLIAGGWLTRDVEKKQNINPKDISKVET